MSGISSVNRNVDDVLAGLGRWLADRFPDLSGIRLDAPGLNEVGGFSSDSIMFHLSATHRGSELSRALVLRMPPRGEGVFRRYDLEQQFRIQHALEPTEVPVAQQIAYEGAEDWLGSPFILMHRVAGRVPPSQPPFYTAGWVLELSVAQRRTLYDNAIGALAVLHKTETGADVRAVAQRPGGAGLESELAWCLDYVDWATDGSPEPSVATLAGWCIEHMPQRRPDEVVCWGDARLGNIIFHDDMSVAALLDWEMVTVAPPELDLGWFLAFREQTRARSGGTDPELDGLRTRGDSIELYEKLLGRAVQDLEWYEMFSMLKLAGACLATKRVIRKKGITDHFILGFPAVERWVLDCVQST